MGAGVEREDGKGGRRGRQEGGDGGEESSGGLVARWRLNCCVEANLQTPRQAGQVSASACMARR